MTARCLRRVRDLADSAAFEALVLISAAALALLARLNRVRQPAPARAGARAVCISCGTDFAGLPDSGGGRVPVLGYACPRCVTPEQLDRIRLLDPRAACPEGVPFGAWMLQQLRSAR